MSKQVIVMRKDLNMRKGKLVAQGSHATMKDLLSKFQSLDQSIISRLNFLFRPRSIFSEDEKKYYFGTFKKICVYVQSEQQLDAVHELALKKGLVSHLIIDSGLTEFKNVATKTCCCIGPDDEDLIDFITGDLPLL
jgi:PTH2 family peptidyl-tRNA hydrolase